MNLKVKKPLFLVSILMVMSFLFSYRSVTFQKKDIPESELQVLSEIVTADSIPTIFFKTTISEFSQPLSRYLFYMDGFDVCSSLANPDSVKLNSDDRNYLVERFSSMEVTNINKLVKEPKNHTLKKIEGHNWSVISLPVVFRDGKYAIYYSKGAYSGQFILMENIEGHWMDVCYSAVWSE